VTAATLLVTAVYAAAARLAAIRAAHRETGPWS
jgi:hypothetical protein